MNKLVVLLPPAEPERFEACQLREQDAAEIEKWSNGLVRALYANGNPRPQGFEIISPSVAPAPPEIKFASLNDWNGCNGGRWIVRTSDGSYELYDSREELESVYRIIL